MNIWKDFDASSATHGDRPIVTGAISPERAFPQAAQWQQLVCASRYKVNLINAWLAVTLIFTLAPPLPAGDHSIR